MHLIFCYKENLHLFNKYKALLIIFLFPRQFQIQRLNMPLHQRQAVQVVYLILLVGLQQPFLILDISIFFMRVNYQEPDYQQMIF